MLQLAVESHDPDQSYADLLLVTGRLGLSGAVLQELTPDDVRHLAAKIRGRERTRHMRLV